MARRRRPAACEVPQALRAHGWRRERGARLYGCSQIHSTNPIERLNREIKRRTNVVSIFPNEPAIVRLIGAILLEQNDEWAVSRRYMSLETLAALCDDPQLSNKAIPAA